MTLAKASLCALALAFALGNAAPTLKLSSKALGQAQRLTKDAPPTCGSCKWVVKTLKCEMEDPDTQAELLAVLTNQFCPALPADLSAQCAQLAPALVPGAIWYLDTFSSAELCSDVSLCGSVAPTHLQGEAHGLEAARANSTCAMCSFLKEAEGSTDVICASLPEALQPTCRSVASAAGDKGCTSAGLCPPAWATAAAADRAPLSLPPRAVASLSKALLHRQSRAAQTSPLGAAAGPLGDYELCSICKSVVAEAALLLSNPDTQKQALEYAKQACASLGDLQNQCLSYVELYGPLAFNIIVQYLNQEACAKIGYCPEPAAFLQASGRGLSIA